MDLFSGKRVLVVENSEFLSETTRQELIRLGAFIIGPVASFTAVIRAFENRLDAAILDVHLDGQMSFLLSEAFEREDIPFVFAVAGSSLPRDFQGYVLSPDPLHLTLIGRTLFGGALQ